MQSDPRGASKLTRRCAIYTRVSTDSGLEQDFNSLDNQREASESYIKSQAHEGWKLVRDRFDDGGFSGGSLERPALQKLLDEIRARRIDVVVVYKVDRLTRSLADFAKLVDLFDAHEVSFISVTQSFNTTTSMGRLTLNMLLSFAQFEREITGERIRDKVAASKRKGIWMGGPVPLGYRVENRTLHIVEEEAEFIRGLFQRYLELGSVVRLKAALDAEAAVTPTRVSRTGGTSGGRPFSRGHLYWILSNPIYIGRLSHKGQVHDGLHAAIVEPEVWETVHERLQAQTVARRDPQPDQHSFLVGKLYDDKGNRMAASYTRKGAKRWRYYVSRALLVGDTKLAGSCPRLPAPEIENEVVSVVRRHLASLARPGGDLNFEPDFQTQQPSLTSSSSSMSLTSLDREQQIATALAVIERVTVHASKVEIALNEPYAGEGEIRSLNFPFARTPARRNRQVIARSESSDESSRAMRTHARAHFKVAMSNARRWLDELIADPAQTIESISARENRSPRSLRMTLSLAFLAKSLAIVTP